MTPMSKNRRRKDYRRLRNIEKRLLERAADTMRFWNRIPMMQDEVHRAQREARQLREELFLWETGVRRFNPEA